MKWFILLDFLLLIKKERNVSKCYDRQVEIRQDALLYFHVKHIEM